MLLWCDVHTRDIKHSTWGIFWFAWPFRYVASVNQALEGTKVKRASKIYVGRSMTVHNRLFCACTPCMNYVTKTFLLVLQYGVKNLFFVRVQGQKSEQIQQRNLWGFRTILLTMLQSFVRIRLEVMEIWTSHLPGVRWIAAERWAWTGSMVNFVHEKNPDKKMLNRVLCNYDMGSFFSRPLALGNIIF